MVAQFVGLLTIILAIWTWRADRRSWMRKLGVAALAAVIAQGILGGITVLFYLPPAVSTAHATLGQTFFCLVVALALFSGRRWVQEPRMALPTRRPSLATLATLSVAAVYLQLILGAAFRHSGMKLLPHLVSAVVVTVILLITITRVLTDYPKVDQLRRPAVMLLTLLMVQLGLGFGAYLTRVQWGREAVQPMMSMIITTVAHVAVGALLLATTVVLAIQSWRHVAVPHEERITSRDPKVVAV